MYLQVHRDTSNEKQGLPPVGLLNLAEAFTAYAHYTAGFVIYHQ